MLIQKQLLHFFASVPDLNIYPDTVDLDGRQVISWRGCPLLSCNKIPIVDGHTSIIAMRVGEEDQGVVGFASNWYT